MARLGGLGLYGGCVLRMGRKWMTGGSSTVPPVWKVSGALEALRDGGGRARVDAKTLALLPHWAYVYGRGEELVEVMDVWWSRVKHPIATDQLKVPSIIVHLGKVQQQFPGVSIVDRLGGWSSLDFLLGRMVQIGFDRYLMEDINSALLGLLYLVNHPSSPPSIYGPHLDNFPDWLEALKGYILSKSPMHSDWNTVVRSGAVVALNLLRRLRVNPGGPVLTALCDYARIGLDGKSGRWPVLSMYVDAVVWFGVDPDQLVAGSWRSWYAACDRLLMEGVNGKDGSLIALTYMPEVAVLYGQPGPFLRILPSWRTALLTLLDQNMDNTIGHLANIIYNCGLFAYKRRAEVDRIADVVERVQGAVADLARSGDIVLVSRFLSGLVYLKWATEANGARRPVRPSSRFMQCLEEQYAHQPYDPHGAEWAAELLLHLYRLECDPSSSLLYGLMERVRVALDGHQPDNAEKILCYSGQACAHFHRRLSSRTADQFWTVWFGAAQRFLDKPSYKSNGERHLRLPMLLRVIVDAADKTGRMGEFGRLQRRWEGLVNEQMDGSNGMTRGNVRKIGVAVRNAIRKHGWTFDPAVVKKITLA